MSREERRRDRGEDEIEETAWRKMQRENLHDKNRL